MHGYKGHNKNKGIFFDGHDRDEVVFECQKFIRRMAECSPLMTKWIDDGTDSLVSHQLALPETQKTTCARYE